MLTLIDKLISKEIENGLIKEDKKLWLM